MSLCFLVYHAIGAPAPQCNAPASWALTQSTCLLGLWASKAMSQNKPPSFISSLSQVSIGVTNADRSKSRTLVCSVYTTVSTTTRFHSGAKSSYTVFQNILPSLHTVHMHSHRPFQTSLSWASQGRPSWFPNKFRYHQVAPLLSREAEACLYPCPLTVYITGNSSHCPCTF